MRGTKEGKERKGEWREREKGSGGEERKEGGGK